MLCSSRDVEVDEGLLGVRFLGWEEVGREVFEGLDQVDQVLAHAVVGVVGGGAVAEGEGFLEGGFVSGEDGEGGVDGGAGRLGHDGLLEGGVLVADVLEELPHVVCGHGLEEPWQGEWSALGRSCSCSLDVSVGGGGWESSVGYGGRGGGGCRHAVIVLLGLFRGLPLSAGHALYVERVCKGMGQLEL